MISLLRTMILSIEIIAEITKEEEKAIMVNFDGGKDHILKSKCYDEIIHKALVPVYLEYEEKQQKSSKEINQRQEEDEGTEYLLIR